MGGVGGADTHEQAQVAELAGNVRATLGSFPARLRQSLLEDLTRALIMGTHPDRVARRLGESAQLVRAPKNQGEDVRVRELLAREDELRSAQHIAALFGELATESPQALLEAQHGDARVEGLVRLVQAKEEEIRSLQDALLSRVLPQMVSGGTGSGVCAYSASIGTRKITVKSILGISPDTQSAPALTGAAPVRPPGEVVSLSESHPAQHLQPGERFLAMKSGSMSVLQRADRRFHHCATDRQLIGHVSLHTIAELSKLHIHESVAKHLQELGFNFGRRTPTHLVPLGKDQFMKLLAHLESKPKDLRAGDVLISAQCVESSRKHLLSTKQRGVVEIDRGKDEHGRAKYEYLFFIEGACTK